MEVNYGELAKASRANPIDLARYIDKVHSLINEGKLFPASAQKKDKGKHRSKAFATFQPIYRDSELRLLLENYFRCKLCDFVDFCDRAKGTAPLLLHACVNIALAQPLANEPGDAAVSVPNVAGTATLEIITSAIKAVAEMAFNCNGRRSIREELEKIPKDLRSESW